ncbi:MAG: exodeoxyribonuclease VII small subunit [Ferruginibacter sp.]|nr:exodeoxyribonuclease VII small subunit [Cytophagales bacterium]
MTITYAEAIRELETLLREIEDDGTDIDSLTEKVKRASELIQACKHKLRTAEETINQVFKEMEEE